MNTIPADGPILKTDVIGRVKTPRERREALLDEYGRSGLCGVKFAALAGIKYSTFATWAQKWRRERGAYPAVKHPKRLRWLEAVAEPNPDLAPNGGDNSPLVLELPGGAKIRINGL